MEQEIVIHIPLEQKICQLCKDTDPDTYHTKVQLRYEKDTSTADQESLKTAITKLVKMHIKKIEENEYGTDFLLTQGFQVNVLLKKAKNKKLTISTKRTFKVTGYDHQKGRKRAKETYLIKLLAKNQSSS